MSIARIYTTVKVRKDWECGKCGAAIKKGVDGRISFAVGFRGYERTRCLKPECRPTRSELESSAVATVYAAQDDIDFSSLYSLDDFNAARDAVVEACNEVVSEYEGNEMIEINYDLQERKDQIENAGAELEGWEPDGDEPEEEKECEDCDGTGEEQDSEDGEYCTTCDGTGKVDNEDERQAWLDEARDSLEQAIGDMDLP